MHRSVTDDATAPTGDHDADMAPVAVLSRRRQAPSRKRRRPSIVVVGHGMVGHRMAEALRAQAGLESSRIIVLGGESSPAYDRVHLGRVVTEGSEVSLTLRPPQWFKRHRIDLHLGDPVARIYPRRRKVKTVGGRTHKYDHLVLATGAEPNRGRFGGTAAEELLTLRTVEDAQEIRSRALLAKARNFPVAIIGAGLLGLELADQLQRLGVSVIVFERAQFPMCRELDAQTGKHLAHLLAESGIVLRTQADIVAIDQLGANFRINFASEAPVDCGLVVAAMGVRPRDALAREAGIDCDEHGGVLVDDMLMTSDPHVSAIGECVRHAGFHYGLVAPGYAMAEAVASRLAGQPVCFTGASRGTRLKAGDFNLTILGDTNASGPDVTTEVFAADDTLRRIVMKKGQVVGAVSMGAWDDLARVQDAVSRHEKLGRAQLRRFRRDEAMWPNQVISIESWPAAAPVCTCLGVTCGALKQARSDGAATLEQLCQRTGASSMCGDCRPLVSTLIEPARPMTRGGASGWMVPLSVLSIAGGAAYLATPALSFSTSITEPGLDVIWRSSLLKQATGFGLLGLFLLSLILSLRKRISWMTWGGVESWKVFHAVIGLLCLVGGVLHTGLRPGRGLDLGLTVAFIGGVILGGVAGGWAIVERLLPVATARIYRRRLANLHVFILWPLPALLIVHILKVYLY